MFVLGVLFLLAGVLLFIQFVWYLIISLGYRKENTARTNAYLARTEYKPKINCHDRYGNYIRCHTRAYYTYTVDSRQYTLEKGFDNTQPGNLKRKETAVYQRKHPDRAYLKRLMPPYEPFACGTNLFLAVIFVLGGISLLRH